MLRYREEIVFTDENFINPIEASEWPSAPKCFLQPDDPRVFHGYLSADINFDFVIYKSASV